MRMIVLAVLVVATFLIVAAIFAVEEDCTQRGGVLVKGVISFVCVGAR